MVGIGLNAQNSVSVTQGSDDLVVAKLLPLQEHQKYYYPQPVEVFIMPESELLKDTSKYVYIPLVLFADNYAYSVFVNDSSGIVVVPCMSHCNYFVELHRYLACM